VTKALALAIAAAALGACDQHPPPDSSPAYIGYTGESTLRQRELEARFRDRVSAQSISSLHRPLTERPHPAGSEARQRSSSICKPH
jgi:hypothetical protein